MVVGAGRACDNRSIRLQAHVSVDQEAKKGWEECLGYKP